MTAYISSDLLPTNMYTNIMQLQMYSFCRLCKTTGALSSQRLWHVGCLLQHPFTTAVILS